MNELSLAPDPCFPFWGRYLPPPLGTVSRADMVWADAILPVLRSQVQQYAVTMGFGLSPKLYRFGAKLRTCYTAVIDPKA